MKRLFKVEMYYPLIGEIHRRLRKSIDDNTELSSRDQFSYMVKFGVTYAWKELQRAKD